MLALAYFVAEFTSPINKETPTKWALSVDGTSNIKVSGAKIVLEGPNVILIEQALKFEFATSNNQTEYKALIAGMFLALEMGSESTVTVSYGIIYFIFLMLLKI